MRRTITGKQKFKGRGALSNPAGRFDLTQLEAVDDGWFVEESPDSIATTLEPDSARAVITTNDSPDIPFEQSINPYRGCEHACPYCAAPDTPILMADGSLREIAKLQAGDAIYGTVRRGWYRRYVKTQVLARWGVIKPAYRITLEDGTELTVGSDHRFLTERGWKYITGTECGRSRRPHLTVNNKLMGTGAFAAPVYQDTDYRCGYLCGLIRGDGMIGTYTLRARGGRRDEQDHFRLALCDLEALERAQDLVVLRLHRDDAVCLRARVRCGRMQAIRAPFPRQSRPHSRADRVAGCAAARLAGWISRRDFRCRGQLQRRRAAHLQHGRRDHPAAVRCAQGIRFPVRGRAPQDRAC